MVVVGTRLAVSGERSRPNNRKFECLLLVLCACACVCVLCVLCVLCVMRVHRTAHIAWLKEGERIRCEAVGGILAIWVAAVVFNKVSIREPVTRRWNGRVVGELEHACTCACVHCQFGGERTHTQARALGNKTTAKSHQHKDKSWLSPHTHTDTQRQSTHARTSLAFCCGRVGCLRPRLGTSFPRR